MKGSLGGGRDFGASSRSPWISLYVGDSVWITASRSYFLKLMLHSRHMHRQTDTHTREGTNTLDMIIIDIVLAKKA